MNLLKLTSLILKLMGIFILVRSIGNLPVFLGSISSVLGADNLNPIFLAESISIPILYFTVCITLIVKSDSIANRLVPKADTDIPLNIHAKIVQNIAFCSIGLVVLTDAIPKLTQILTTYIMSGQFPNDGLMNGFYSQLAANIVQLFIGLFLVLGSNGIVNLVEKIRLPREIKNA
jgi:hypothetical protein